MSKKTAKEPAQGGQALQQAATPVMYIGPNILSKGLKAYTVYKQEPTEIIAALQAEYKTINRLFVPVSAVTQAMADLQKKGTPVNLAYNDMRK